jgi:membrane-bound serine protease (ClpP class)
MLRLTQIFLAIPLFLAAGLLLHVESVSSADNPVIQLTIEGAIGPATDDYIGRALETAARRRAELVVIRMDTPGGLDTAMRGIIKSITSSAVPVASYVAPTGARAASAGTYILYASHIAADAGKQKIINDAVAYLRSLAELRGRNQEWAEKAVREAASIPASEALQLGVIDIVATGMADLMKQLDGREVPVLGQKRILHTAGSVIDQLAPDWRSRFLGVITNPNIAYILMLIGIYGLMLEFSNPGAIVPGTVGAIALLLALYSFQLLPINYAGMGLILLGVALMVGEAFQPSFGVLGIGGLIAFVVGSIFLMDTDVPGFGIDISVIVTSAIISALVFIVVIGMAIKARRRPVVSGLEELVGAEAIALADFDRQGRVSIHSETWQALSSVPLRKGQPVKVSGIEGLTLRVEPLDTSTQEERS